MSFQVFIVNDIWWLQEKEVYTQWAGRTYEIINIAYVEGFIKSYNFLTVQNLKVAKIKHVDIFLIISEIGDH